MSEFCYMVKMIAAHLQDQTVANNLYTIGSAGVNLLSIYIV